MKKKTLLLIGFSVILFACAPRKTVKPQTETVPTPSEEPVSQAEPSVRYSDWQDVSEAKTIYFDFDASDLKADARDTLKENAEYLKNNADLNVLIEGHCDERGTIEYNLALGQRRAMAVRDYYISLGIAASRLGTISYGAEKPFDNGHSEAAWSKNRRAETKVRSKV
jgi:peptidoglycan-associated lipoprotein